RCSRARSAPCDSCSCDRSASERPSFPSSRPCRRLVRRCRSSGWSVLRPAGCSHPDAREKHAHKEAWLSFPKVDAFPGGKPLRTLRKGLGKQAQKAEARDEGPTAPAASRSPEGEIAETVRSAPGRD